MNDIIKYILLYVGLVFTVGKIFDDIYLFQVKEYRFDRLLIPFKEEGLWSMLYKLSVRFPAKSLRNLIMLVTSILLLIPLTYVLHGTSYVVLILFIVASPLIALIIVSLLVLLTEVPAQGRRRMLIRQAKNKLVGTKVKAIGITGSYGKTTTKEYLYHILSQKFETAKTLENMNTDVGIAISVLKGVTKETEFFVMEVGAYTRGEIKRSCQILTPTYAIVTAIGNQHLGLFGSKDNLVLAKKELLDAVPKDGRVYLNKSITERAQLTKGIKGKTIFYSLADKADISVDQKGRAQYQGLAFTLAQVPTRENLLPAIAVAVDLGVEKELIDKALTSLPTLNTKLGKSVSIGSGVLITDTANSSVEGFISALSTLSAHKGSRVAVSKGIIELGEERESSYRRILDEVKKAKATLYTTDPLFEILDMDQVVVYLKSEKLLLARIIQIAKPKTAILLEGRFTPRFIRSLTLK